MWRMEGGVHEGEIFFTVHSLVTFRFTYSKINFKIKFKKTHKTVFERANSIRKSAPSFTGGSLVKNMPASARRHRLIPDPRRSQMPQRN